MKTAIFVLTSLDSQTAVFMEVDKDRKVIDYPILITVKKTNWIKENRPAELLAKIYFSPDEQEEEGSK